MSVGFVTLELRSSSIGFTETVTPGIQRFDITPLAGPASVAVAYK